MRTYHLLIAGLFMSFDVAAVDLSVMGDLDYQDGSSAKDQVGGFSLGQLDFFAHQDISEDTHGVIEVVVEDADGFAVDVERLFIEKKFSDDLRIAAGRYHTPIDYYNANYHHGMLLQATTQRPFFLDFEDGSLSVLPTHLVGLLASGKHTVGAFDLGYQLGVGNGSSINNDDLPADREIEVNNSGDNNSSKATVLRLSMADPVNGISAGVSHMTNKIAESGDLANYGVDHGATLDDQSISSIDAQFHSDRINLQTEYFRIDNQSRVPGFASSESASAWFAEISVPITNKNSVAYRHEVLSIDKQDYYFSTVLPRTSAQQNVIAFRHDFDDSNAIKVEYRHFDAEGDNADNIFALQWAFMLP